MSAPPFHPYGASHLVVLSVTAAILALMCFWARTGREWLARPAERILGCVLLLIWPGNLALAYFTNSLNRDEILPAQLCDVAAIIGGIALLTRKPALCELLYFWGLAGTLQGLITPALAVDFPRPEFFGFFALHCGVVLAALYVVLGAGITPRRGAVGRAMAWYLVYGAVAGIIDALLGSNYGFLRSKPAQASLLDFVGQWPWYIGSLILLGLVFFTILDLPWWLRSRGNDKNRMTKPE